MSVKPIYELNLIKLILNLVSKLLIFKIKYHEDKQNYNADWDSKTFIHIVHKDTTRRNLEWRRRHWESRRVAVKTQKKQAMLS